MGRWTQPKYFTSIVMNLLFNRKVQISNCYHTGSRIHQYVERERTNLGISIFTVYLEKHRYINCCLSILTNLLKLMS